MRIAAAYGWLADQPRHLKGIRALQVALGIMLFFRAATEARFSAYLWGPHGVAAGSTVYLAGPRLGAVLDLVFARNATTFCAVVIMGLFGLLLASGRAPRLATAGCLIAVWLFEQRLPQLPDGGDNVARIVLCYMLFLSPTAAGKPLRTWVHNLAVLAIAIQVCCLYEISGLMKAYGDKWHHGLAMYYVSNVEWFSLPFLRRAFRNPLVVTLATYVPMLYQLYFPIAVLSRLRVPWICLGVMFHLGVGTMMGLVSFSIVMIGLELFFLADTDYDAAAAWINTRLHLIRPGVATAAEKGLVS